MRKIKFRAWLKAEKQMVEVTVIDFYLKSIYWVYDPTVFDKEADMSKIELMQFIGLKDKNGVEVYEGDVVEATRYDGLAVTGVVDFRDCSFVINTGYQTIYTWIDYQIEVIGNVWEQPELLKETEDE